MCGLDHKGAECIGKKQTSDSALLLVQMYMVCVTLSCIISAICVKQTCMYDTFIGCN